MPGVILHEVDHFVPVASSKEAVDFADLDLLDISTYNDSAESRKLLAEQVRRAMTTQGFFTVINHGISEQDIERQVDIGHTILKRTSQDEKVRLRAPIREEGHYFGFKPRGFWATSGKAVDKIENFNVYRKLGNREQPQAFEPYRDEVQTFVDKTHQDILYKILRLFAIALEIDDEDFFVKLHSYEGEDMSWLRYMEYCGQRGPADTESKTLWLAGHRDFTSLSLLFSQPMTSLQVRDVSDNAEWKYVAHIPGGIIVNAGEIMQWFTGGYFIAAIHRVVEPPKDQQGYDRCSAFYFCVPNSEVVINTVLDQSPVLRKAGVQLAHKPEDAPTSNEWCTGRVKLSGKSDVYDGKDAASVTEQVGKVTTTWFR